MAALKAHAPRRLLGAVLAFAAFAMSLIALIGPGIAQASNGTCVLSEGWTCEWSGGSNWPQNTKLWFEAPGGENERNWHGIYGFSTEGVERCVGFKDSNGNEIPQACSTGTASEGIPSERDPGWVYVVHHANGPRPLSGRASS